MHGISKANKFENKIKDELFNKLTSDFHTTYGGELQGCSFFCSHLRGEKSVPVLPEAPLDGRARSPAVFLLRANLVVS